MNKYKDVRGAGSTSTESGTAPFAPPGLPKQMPTKTITNITDDVVNAYIKENPETVTNDWRNERVMKTQRKQMSARSLLKNASWNVYFVFYIRYIIIKHGE